MHLKEKGTCITGGLRAVEAVVPNAPQQPPLKTQKNGVTGLKGWKGR